MWRDNNSYRLLIEESLVIRAHEPQLNRTTHSMPLLVSLNTRVPNSPSILFVQLFLFLKMHDCIDSRNGESRMVFKVAVIFQFILKLLPSNKSNVCYLHR